ncbi:MAG: hypothetical protein AB8B69_25435 [Chitinophagales bacterium]
MNTFLKQQLCIWSSLVLINLFFFSCTFQSKEMKERIALNDTNYPKPIEHTNTMTTTKVPNNGKYNNWTQWGISDKETGIVTYAYEFQKKTIDFEEIENRQRPRVTLELRSWMDTYEDKKYLTIDMGETQVWADRRDRLAYDTQDARGYYIEEVNVEIQCLAPDIKLASHGPNTNQSKGSVSSSTGVNIQTGIDVNMGGDHSSEFTLSRSVSTILSCFRVEDHSSETVVKTKYSLYRTNVAKSKNGVIVSPETCRTSYSEAKKLISIDTTGVSLYSLPDSGKRTITATMATFKVPDDYTEKALFKVTISFNLMCVKKDKDVSDIAWEYIPIHYTVTEQFEFDVNRTE